MVHRRINSPGRFSLMLNIISNGIGCLNLREFAANIPSYRCLHSQGSMLYTYIIYPLRYERVYLLLGKVTGTPFHMHDI